MLCNVQGKGEHNEAKKLLIESDIFCYKLLIESDIFCYTPATYFRRLLKLISFHWNFEIFKI